MANQTCKVVSRLSTMRLVPKCYRKYK